MNVNQISTILQEARERAQLLALPYSGALTPAEAYTLMQHLPGAVLLDVRTMAEWQFVGTVPNALCIEWLTYPGMLPNPQFIETLRMQVPPDATLMLMCRSGVRSDDAARALMQSGFERVYNVLEGFEGDKDNASQRNHLMGWKKRGLPWVQS